MKQIMVGSQNRAKLEAVQLVFPDYAIEAIPAPSQVSAQPFSDEETRQGALHRARYALKKGLEGASSPECVWGIGFEGGVMALAGQYYLCNWGALALPSGEVLTASGVRISLAADLVAELKAGRELGEVMVERTKDPLIAQTAGAIGVLTQQEMSRRDIYVQLLRVLKGQLSGPRTT